MNLIHSNSVTMSSSELAELTGKQHKHVIRDIREMLEALEADGPVLGHVQEDKDSRGYTAAFHLDKELTETLLTGYSIPLRRKVIARLAELESRQHIALPDFSNPAAAARAWAEQFEIAQTVMIERDKAVATKAEIGNRREATAMNTASQAVKKVHALEVQLDHSKEYCTIKRMEMLKHGQKFEWRRLKSTCTEMGVPAIDVFDQNYGTVKSYHVDVWLEAYGIGLDD